jgi:excisionase family DNA binding protein
MLLRPSELARFWELHPKTVYLWIKAGRLPAVKTPGDQFRVRSEDVPAFCNRSGLPLPPALTLETRRVMILGATPGAQRMLRRALKGRDVVVSAFPSALDGLLAAAQTPPSLLVLDASSVDAEDAVRALRRTKATSGVPVLVYQVLSSARAAVIVRAGARWALVRDKELVATLGDALANR